MKTLQFAFFLAFFIGIYSCEDNGLEQEFEKTDKEVYKIIEVDSIFNNSFGTYLTDESTGHAEYYADYYCGAEKSYNLEGNVLKIYLKADYSNKTCTYHGSFTFDVIENEGMKMTLYTWENENYKEYGTGYVYKLEILDSCEYSKYCK